MIKKLLILLTLSICLTFNAKTKTILATPLEEDFPLNGKSALLMDFYSGNIIISKNIDQKLYPASMTKMMGIYLICQALENKSLELQQEITISAQASSMGGSQIYLQENEKMSVEDLFKAVCIASANDAMYALGEAISGNINLFIKQMNKKAKEFKMNNTNFVNVTGFDDPNHYTSAYDMALLGRRLLLDYQDLVLPLTSKLEDHLRVNTSNPFWLVNTNKLIANYEGMDGLKTGYTKLAKYCLTATAKKDDLRFIAVSMSNATINQRSQDIKSMFDYGFANYKAVKVYEKNQVIAATSFRNAKDSKTNLIFTQDVFVSVKKNEDISKLKENYRFSVYNAPIKKYSKVGVLEIQNGDGWVFSYEFSVASEVKLLKWTDYFFKLIKDLFF